MPLASLFRLVLIVAAVLAVGAFLAGYGVGARKGVRGRTAIAIAAISFFILFVGGTIPLARQYGPAVTQRMVLLSASMAVALAGGYMTSLRRQQGKNALAGSKVVATIVVVGIFLYQIHSANQSVTQAATELGLDQNAVKDTPEKNKTCSENLKSLYVAFSMYAENWDALPPAASWLSNDDLTSRVPQNEWLHCPAVSTRNDDKYGYAYNTEVAEKKMNGKPLAEMPNAAKTPLLYDSADLTKSAHDAVSSLPKPGRHSGKNNILYCDGHVEAVAPQ